MPPSFIHVELIVNLGEDNEELFLCAATHSSFSSCSRQDRGQLRRDPLSRRHLAVVLALQPRLRLSGGGQGHAGAGTAAATAAAAFAAAAAAEDTGE